MFQWISGAPISQHQSSLNLVQLSCICQYFWSLLVYQHMLDTRRPHRHPLFDFSFVCSLCCFLKPLHCSQNLSFVPNVELSNALNAAFFMVIDLFYLSREWVSVCVSLLSPSCPFVRNWAINLPECWEQNIHYNNQSFCSKQRKIPHKMCNLVGDEVILAGKYCTSGRSLHSPCLIL